MSRRRLEELLDDCEHVPGLCAYLEHVIEAHLEHAEEAAEFYTSFHWGNAPTKLSAASAPSVQEGEVLPVLGELRLVEYIADKGGETAIWVHPFRNPRPVLAFHQASERLLIVGGGYVVNERGIVG